jgi:hypothetical protein
VREGRASWRGSGAERPERVAAARAAVRGGRAAQGSAGAGGGPRQCAGACGRRGAALRVLARCGSARVRAVSGRRAQVSAALCVDTERAGVGRARENGARAGRCPGERASNGQNGA